MVIIGIIYILITVANWIGLFKMWGGYEKFNWFLLSIVPILNIWTLYEIIYQIRADEYNGDSW